MKTRQQGRADARIYRVGAFDVTVHARDGLFAGIGQIACDGWPLRERDARHAVRCETTDGHLFEDWTPARVASGAGRLTLRFDGLGRAQWHDGTLNCYGDPNVRVGPPVRPPRARLTIEFRSGRQRGLPCLRIRTGVRLTGAAADWLQEEWSWAPGGRTAGATYFAQRWGSENGGWEHSLDRNATFSTRDAMTVNGRSVNLGSLQPRGGGGPSLDYIYKPQGALALYRDRIGTTRGLAEKRPGETTLRVVDQTWGPRGPVQTSAWLTAVVYRAPRGRALTRERAHDLWTRLWGDHTAALAARTGIARIPPRPGIFCESWNMGSGRFFEHQAKFLDAIAATGAKRVFLHTLPHPHKGNNCCGLYDLSILESEGGLPALRRYTDAAHVRGLEVIGWASWHVHNESPLLKRHPDWAVRDRRGHVFGGGYAMLAALDFGHPAVRRFYLDGMLALRRAGGLDALWLDSVLNGFFYPVNFARAAVHGGPGPQIAGLIEVLAALSMAGLKIVTESATPFGLSCGNIGFQGDVHETALTGNLLFRALGCGELGLYRTNLWARGKEQVAGKGIAPMTYFRALAHAAPIALYYDTSDHPHCLSPDARLPLTPPPAIPDLPALNEAYNRVEPLMDVREVLPDDAGVLWHPLVAAPADLTRALTLDPARAPGPRVLFSFQQRPVALPGAGWEGLAARSLLNKTETRLQGPVLAAAARDVYVIE